MGNNIVQGTAGKIEINARRLMERLETLAQFGQNNHGGMDRPLGSIADEASRQWLQSCWQNELGLEVTLDAMANMWGSQKDIDIEAFKHKKPIVMGSHSDTVPDGGKYDGALGVLMATEVVQTLLENKAALQHPLQLINFTGEEPNDYGVSTLGSKVLCGRWGQKEIDSFSHSVTGEPLTKALARLGGAPENAESARLPEGFAAAFLECHIEQGRHLYDSHQAVAAVSAITGIYRETIVVKGEANHAGTTLYKHRRDALAAAAEVILAVEDLLKKPQLEGVAVTVGHVEVSPNASNIIPGEVRLSLDLRTADPQKRQEALLILGSSIAYIAKRRGVEIKRNLQLNQSEIPMDAEVIAAMCEAAAGRSNPARQLVSMAGHDAANMARLVPAGMLFVQSTGGYSHCPKEHTRKEEITIAAQVLLDTVLLLDRRLS